jgi:hypothetical protein
MIRQRHTAPPGRHIRPSVARRGATVVIVLGLLAMTLAVSYAMMRTQVTSLQIQNNLSRRDSARHAAHTGMAAALRRIHDADWPGVDVPLAGDLGNGVGYTIKFITGDESLQPGDPAYQEYPFRLTIHATGFAVDPGDPNRRAEHQVQTVVQLVRRAFSSQPAEWTNAQSFTLVAWDDADVQFPAQIAGKVKVGDRLRLGRDYPNGVFKDLVLSRYLRDLERMRQAKLGDHRLFTGQVHFPYENNSAALENLNNDLNVSTVNIPRGGMAPVEHPGQPETYRLYPGGKEYAIPKIQSHYGSELSGVTLARDVRENPLGVFWSSTSLTLGDRATVEGTIISHGVEPDILVEGQEVTWRAPELPALYGQPENEHVYLPAGLVYENMRVAGGAQGSLFGTVVVWKRLEVPLGDEQTAFNLTGRAFTMDFSLRGRSSWDLIAWPLSFFAFWEQLDRDGAEVYFPRWMQTSHGMKVAPKIKFRPSDATDKHHWQDWSLPVYAPHPDDAGLLWDVLRWTEVSST